MKTPPILLVCLIPVLCCRTLVAADAGLIPYDFPAEQARSASCTATVDDTAIPVFGSQVGSFLNFGMSGPVVVRLTFAKAPQQVVIRPLNEKIKPTIAGNTCTFTLPRALTLSVELDGNLKQPIFLFANPPIENPCKKDDPKVRYFAAGKIHEAGEIDLKDGETLYLEPGAVIHGVVRAVNASHVAIRGAGIIDATPRKNKINLLAFRECNNVLQENVILLNSWGWNNHLSGSRDVTVRRVRVLGWRANCDGIDIEYCCKVRVDGCFWRASDDCVSIKAMYPPGTTGVPFIEMINPEIYGRHQVAHIKDDTVGDIVVENSVFWNDLPGNAFDLGFDLRIDRIRNVTVRNCDIIHVLRGASFSIHNGDRAKVDNLLLENIRIEDTDELFDFYVGLSVYSDDCPKPYRRDNPKRSAPPGNWRDLASGDNAGQWLVPSAAESQQFVGNRGQINNITIRDMQVLTAPRSGSSMCGFDEDHGVRNVTLENLTIQGKPVMSAQDLRLRTRHAQDINFK